MNERDLETLIYKHQAFNKPIFSRLKTSKIPTWLDTSKTEGLEYKENKLIPFWVKDAERIYNQPPSNTIELIMKDFNSVVIDDQIPKMDNDQIDNNNIPILPELITNSLLLKWSKMTTTERMLQFQSTPKNQVYKKPVGAGNNASYVKGNYMVREANAAFLFKWNSKIDGFSITDKNVACYGTITVDIDGTQIIRSCVGNEECNAKMNPQLAMKSAHTDMIKKGLSLLGFNNDVYSGEYDL